MVFIHSATDNQVLRPATLQPHTAASRQRKTEIAGVSLHLVKASSRHVAVRREISYPGFWILPHLNIQLSG